MSNTLSLFKDLVKFGYDKGENCSFSGVLGNIFGVYGVKCQKPYQNSNYYKQFFQLSWVT